MRPQPCPDAELRSLALYYFDWQVEKCHQSHLKICPGDEKLIFSQKLNAFKTLWDCLNSCAPQEAKCDLNFANSGESANGTVDKIFPKSQKKFEKCKH